MSWSSLDHRALGRSRNWRRDRDRLQRMQMTALAPHRTGTPPTAALVTELMNLARATARGDDPMRVDKLDDETAFDEVAAALRFG